MNNNTVKDDKGISRIRDVKIGEVSEDTKHNLHNFFMELVDLCNKYRVSFVIEKIFCLPTTSFLEVAGFYYDDTNKITLPAYRDTRTVEEDNANSTDKTTE